VAVVAPTGIAALNVGGQTIHSFFQIDFEIQDTENAFQMKVGDRLKTILTHLQTLVIDEVSMVRVDVMEAIHRKLQIARESSLPFGGVQIVCFGDLYQLPPVVTDGEIHRYFDHIYGGVFFFNAPVLRQYPLRIFEMEHSYRQTDAHFLKILDAIRVGDHSAEILAAINARVTEEIPLREVITLTGNNAAVGFINQRKLDALPYEEQRYHATILGDIKQSTFPRMME
jgi:hypothetical protein